MRPGSDPGVSGAPHPGNFPVNVPPPDAIAPDGSEIQELVTEARRASLVQVRLPAGGRSLPVRHRTVEEIWYFLEGAGTVWLREPDGSEHRIAVSPGATVVIPTGWAFQFAANPGGDLRFLCHTTPPWPGAAEAEAVSPPFSEA